MGNPVDDSFVAVDGRCFVAAGGSWACVDVAHAVGVVVE